MKLLAIDSSAKSASTAIVEDGKLISECYVNTTLTHSTTLMPMVDNMLKQADLKIEDIDALCINTGPGSFTGIRIGVAAVKGLAFMRNLPCASVSTLESMAYNFTDTDCIVCGTMDARCNQVYTALFQVRNGAVTRLTDDDAISIDALEQMLKSEYSDYDGNIYLAGDGAALCFNKFTDMPGNIILAGENRRYQRAYGAALAAFNKNEFIDSASVMPVYLRPPQAERELKLKLEEAKK